MVNTNTGLPGNLATPVVDKNTGLATPIWLNFFLSLWTRTGGATGTPTLILDSFSSVPGSTLYRGLATWLGLAPGAQYKVLRMGAAFPEWDTLDGNSFGAQAAGSFFAGPTAGANAIPTFKNPLGAFPGTNTNDNAVAGNIGEYVFSQVASGAAVVLSSGVAADITSIPLTAGDWDVWGNVASAPAGSSTTSVIRGWINTASATDPGQPNAGAYCLQQGAIAAGLGQVLPTGATRISLGAGGGTVYLSTKITFATSTMGAYGFLGARRAR